MPRPYLLIPAVLTLLLGAAASAQFGVPPMLQALEYHDSGLQVNNGAETRSMHRLVLQHPGAASMRVLFAEVTLGPGDWIEVTSTEDGQRHRLTPLELARWEFSSAYLNGDTVTVDLILAPGSSGQVEIAGYLYGIGGGGIVGTDTICGVDDRVTSSDPRCGRFVSSPTTTGGGCTIWLASADSVACSAGHCFDGGSLVVAEFDVPPSLPSGALRHPPIEDQFTVDPTTVSFVNNGPGDDWGICRLNPNVLGQSAAARYGFYEIGAFLPVAGETIRITGCGTDDTVDNQVQQTSTGPFVAVNGNSISYAVDSTGGNSGSPILHESSGMAVGIHTHGGCNPAGGANSGTSTLHAGYLAARNALIQSTPTAAPSASFTPTSSVVLVGEPVTFVSTSTQFPSSFAWEANGDAVIDGTASALTFTYATPGSYAVTLQVANAFGSNSVTVPAAVTVLALQPAALPYQQSFNGGLPLGPEWYLRSDIGGRIQAASFGTTSPISGGLALAFDATTQNEFATNEATLAVDLTGMTSVVLSYWWKEVLDEDDPEDGVFLSDGTQEILAFSHVGGPSDWTHQVLDVAAIAQQGGLALGADFRIIFRQRDNFPLGTDGLLVDDVQVFAAVAGGGESNVATASLRLTGAVDGNGLAVPAMGPGPYFLDAAVGATVACEFGGDPGRPFILLLGPLGVGHQLLAPVGQLDLGFLPNYGDLVVALNGAAPVGFLDYLAVLGPNGRQTLSFAIPSLPPGPLFALQALVYQIGSGLPRFSAATELRVL